MLEIKSVIPNIAWPAIPNARGSQMLAMQFQLEQSQWFSHDQLLACQIKQLRLVLHHAYATVPFYRQRFDDVGLPPGKIGGVTDWLRLPLLTRREIQLAGTALHSTGAKEHGEISKSVTSGSTGQPVTTLGTTVTRLMFNALTLRQHVWYRRDLSRKLVAIRSLGTQTPELAFTEWGPATSDVVKTGPAFSLDVHTSVDDQAEFLLKHDPDYLITYPSVVGALTEHFATCDRKLNRLREIRTFGEVLDPQVRSACWDVWGVGVVDSYSSQELGDIAIQCPDHEHYHIQSENLLVEVLDDTGRQCEPGEIGKLVITTLHNFAMPLIRYDIGDFAEVGPPCPCGRGLPVLKRIVGRQRNMFVLPDGRRIWPALELTPDEQGTSLPPVQQFQLVQRTLTSVELLVVAPRTFTDEEKDLLRTWVNRAIGFSMELKIIHVQEIARGATGKYEDFRSEVQQSERS